MTLLESGAPLLFFYGIIEVGLGCVDDVIMTGSQLTKAQVLLQLAGKILSNGLHNATRHLL